MKITKQEIDTQLALADVSSVQAGANNLFVGTARETTYGEKTVRLEYECHQEMAVYQFRKLCNIAFDKWPLVAISIVHRVGIVELGEASIAIAISSPHRKDCFDAAVWLMDEIKKVVPIWKKEVRENGDSNWVHQSQN